MAGLPRSKDTTPARDVMVVWVVQPIEHMTMALRRGDPFTAQSLQDMLIIKRRLGAFFEALDARLAEIPETTE